jgi:muramoyltetrapeptide carboxypeptidase
MERDQALVGTVALLALGGYEADPQRVTRASSYFEGRGLKVVVAPRPDERIQRFSASESIRLAALERVARDPEIRLVVGLRGGYGLSRLVSRIDFGGLAEGIRSRGVRWVGQSDWTAFQLALLAATGAQSFAGPLAGPDFGAEQRDPFTERSFWSAVRGEPLRLEWAQEGPAIDVAGILWGGNLAMLASLVGTPYMPQIEGGILFLEDVNEHPYRIERMLLQLEAAGILAAQKALVLGTFSGYRLTDYDQGYDFEAMLDYLRTRLSLPIVTGLPFGHEGPKATLPVGAQVRLRCSGAQVLLEAG